MKNFNDFLNEGKIEKEVIVKSIEIIDFDGNMWANSENGSAQEAAEMTATFLSLVSGDMFFGNREFEITGTTESGKHLTAFQNGEFNLYGGPYTPKMKKFKVKLDGKDLSRQIQMAFAEYGW